MFPRGGANLIEKNIESRRWQKRCKTSERVCTSARTARETEGNRSRKLSGALLFLRLRLSVQCISSSSSLSLSLSLSLFLFVRLEFCGRLAVRALIESAEINFSCRGPGRLASAGRKRELPVQNAQIATRMNIVP